MEHLFIWMNVCQHCTKKKALFMLFLPGPAHLVGVAFQVSSLVQSLSDSSKIIRSSHSVPDSMRLMLDPSS